MHTIYDFHHQVLAEEIDGLGHVNNLVYLRWMQDAAVEHSSANGWSPGRFTEIGYGFVVRSHRIKYSRPAKVGEKIIVRTWVKSMQEYTANRAYEIIRQSEGLPREERLATAQTKWVFVDLKKGSPEPIPSEIVELFDASKHQDLVFEES